MGIIDELESMKYRFASELIKSEEQYDKKKNVLSAKSAFELCAKRYLLMRQILLPIEKKIGDNIDILDINFSNGMQDDMSIIIKYLKDGKLHMIAISVSDFQYISIVASDNEFNENEFVNENSDVVFKVFNDIMNYSLNEEITIKSTTGKFVIEDNCDSFIIKDIEGKMFSLENKYSSYEKTHSLVKSSKLECNIPKLKELLEVEDNILALYNHLHIYEDELFNEKIKELTHR